MSAWAAAAATLLGDAPTWLRMSACSARSVQTYSYDNAARGLAEAIVFAHTEGHRTAAMLQGEVP